VKSLAAGRLSLKAATRNNGSILPTPDLRKDDLRLLLMIRLDAAQPRLGRPLGLMRVVRQT
jgi:hypothetical protein